MACVLKTSKRTIVPWFSMYEWEEVYKQVYSEDLSLVKRGYEQMLLWKARSPSLPAGIECTLSLIHVWLQYREVWSQIISGTLLPHSKHNMRLMLSTAIMRFLNQIAIVAQDGTETMYKMAKKLHIPDWVVTIRHDVAHGLCLPSLTVLQEAMQFSLGWINEHYWKGEADFTHNYVVTNDHVSIVLLDALLEHMELWQALTLYKQAGHVHVNSIPDDKLKLRLKTLIESNLKGGYDLIQTVGNDSPNSLGNWTIIKLLEQIMNHMKTFLTVNMKHLNNECLVNGVLESEIFFPDSYVLSALYIDNEEKDITLPMQLNRLWEDVLQALQPVDVLPVLIQRLIDLSGLEEESAYKQRMSAIWVKELCMGIAKAWKMNHFMHQYDTRCVKKNGKTARKLIIQEFDRVHPELREILSLKLTHLPHFNSDFVKKTMLMPNKWTHIFLPSLLELVEPALTDPSKFILSNLIEIYTNEGKRNSDGQHMMYTVANLENKCTMEIPFDLVTMDTAATEDNLMLNEDEAGWFLSKTHIKWEDCPLGALPWQRDMVAMEVMPSTVVWTSSPAVQVSNIWEEEVLFLTPKIDWEEIKLSKRSMKNKGSHLTLVKKAFEAVGITGIESIV